MNSFGTEHLRAIGNLKVSPLGLGSVKFGRNTNVKYPRTFQLPDMTELASLIGCASDLGINLIDTAPAYGASEERLGRLLVNHRQHWVISTKVGENYTDRSTFDFSTAATVCSIENSLSRLHTDYLDIVLIHCSDDDAAILRSTPIIRDLRDMQDRGMIRYIGASTKSVAGGLLALQEMDLVMVVFNSSDQSQLPVIQQAESLGKKVLLKKVFESGHSSDMHRSLTLALQQPAVAAAIVGTINSAHLLENVRHAVLASDFGRR